MSDAQQARRSLGDRDRAEPKTLFQPQYAHAMMTKCLAPPSRPYLFLELEPASPLIDSRAISQSSIDKCGVLLSLARWTKAC